MQIIYLHKATWQYFCGMEFFENKTPCDATTLGRWRKRVGNPGIEKLLQPGS